MQTGDGLLARLRPSAGMTAAALAALAEASRRHGNGLIEITARGSLQIRGLARERLPAFVAAVEASGIVAHDGPAIDVSPLAGLDVHAPADGRAFEAALRQHCAEILASPRFAAKLTIVIDDGSLFGMQSVDGDIRLCCRTPLLWQLSLGRGSGQVMPLMQGRPDEAVAATARLLAMFCEAGTGLRGADLPLGLIEAAFDHRPAPAAGTGRDPVCGITPLHDGQVVLGLRPRLGQWHAEQVSAFLSAAEDLGLGPERPVRLAPGRRLLLPLISLALAEDLALIAPRFGLSAEEQDPAAAIIACAGQGACASGHFATRPLAEAILGSAQALLDGSLVIHLSGCRKGCAHHRPALSLVGVEGGMELLFDGRPGEPGDQDIAGGGGNFAIEKLARLVKAERRPNETAAACLLRLRADGVMGALRQE